MWMGKNACVRSMSQAQKDSYECQASLSQQAELLANYETYKNDDKDRHQLLHQTKVWQPEAEARKVITPTSPSNGSNEYREVVWFLAFPCACLILGFLAREESHRHGDLSRLLGAVLRLDDWREH